MFQPFMQDIVKNWTIDQEQGSMISESQFVLERSVNNDTLSE